MTLSDIDVGETLAAICEAAAGVILPLWRSGLTVHSKADESPVTEADRRGEALILERLAAAFPDVPVVSEEDASEFGTPDQIGPVFFLVDPLDGTKAFVRGDPNFTVNIALIVDGRPVAGAVTAPPTGETWFTRAGEAWKRVNGGAPQPVRVRAWDPATALGLISHTATEEQIRNLTDQYGFVRTQAMDSSIKLCRIAEGAADIYPRHGPTMEWDIAAAHAVLLGAGGSLSTPEGEAFVYGKADKRFRNGWFVARGG
ncbi:3'(2'),5'-bisphosphate nucleotidase CysQ [Phenylobacterium sp. VNQ135]|uniref:3'(2'),5'-bisphosphate nucleotidase CysQ n=1 Tax=Phenylobacterium sp. VNQ135 TaxID=3400922 RepID=UPI003BFC69FF